MSGAFRRGGGRTVVGITIRSRFSAMTTVVTDASSGDPRVVLLLSCGQSYESDENIDGGERGPGLVFDFDDILDSSGDDFFRMIALGIQGRLGSEKSIPSASARTLHFWPREVWKCLPSLHRFPWHGAWHQGQATLSR